MDVEENGKTTFSVLVLFFIYKYTYNISMYKARKPREANKAYVKDCLKDTQDLTRE